MPCPPGGRPPPGRAALPERGAALARLLDWPPVSFARSRPLYSALAALAGGLVARAAAGALRRGRRGRVVPLRPASAEAWALLLRQHAERRGGVVVAAVGPARDALLVELARLSTDRAFAPLRFVAVDADRAEAAAARERDEEGTAAVAPLQILGRAVALLDPTAGASDLAAHLAARAKAGGGVLLLAVKDEVEVARLQLSGGTTASAAEKAALRTFLADAAADLKTKLATALAGVQSPVGTPKKQRTAPSAPRTRG